MTRSPWLKVAVFESKSHPGKSYKVSINQAQILGCDCPAFRFQRKPIEQRTCKHTSAVAIDREVKALRTYVARDADLKALGVMRKSEGFWVEV